MEENEMNLMNLSIKESSPTSSPSSSRHYSITNLKDSSRLMDLNSNYKLRKKSILKCDLSQKDIINNFIDSNKQMEINIDQSSPPVDNSLFFDNLETFKKYDINGNNIKNTINSTVNIIKMKKLFELKCINIDDDDDDDGNNKSINVDDLKTLDKVYLNIAYIWLCFRGKYKLLNKLELAGALINYVEPVTGINAISAATLSGSVDCVKYLLSKGIDVNYINVVNNYTPLHLAALINNKDITELLLDNGAKMNDNNKSGDVDDDVDNNYNFQDIEPVLHCAVRSKSIDVVKLLLERGASVVLKNRYGENPLHISCFIQSIILTELLLNTAGNDINAVDRTHRTPLHCAVMNRNSSVDLIELLINNGSNVNANDKFGFTPLHIAALNEQSKCVDILIWYGGDVSAITSTGLSALNIILRKIPESLQVFRQRLDSSIRLKRLIPHNREFEMLFNFDILFPSNNPCETSLINIFVLERQKDLLSHPLVMAFLHLKWEKIRKFYLMRIFLYAMTVICMTTYVLTALAYKCYNYNDINNSLKICGSKRIAGFLFRKTIIEIEWYLTLFLTCITIPRKIFGFMVYKSIKQYFSIIDNLLDSIVIISVFVTSFIYTGRTYDWQNYIGAFAILCAWTNLMLMVGQLPAFGTYVAMFTHIQFEFAKLLLAYSGLLIGFTISFCVIFVGEPSFGNPFTGLIKVLAMMAGELDFEGLINQPDQLTDGPFVLYHPLSVCSQILFTLFLVFVTVILMNLLVGIAVHDIQGLRNHAGLTKLVRQTKLILFTEMVLNNNAIPFVIRKWMSDHDIDMENRKKYLIVKPLNPLEKRLPKEILKAAYEIAQKNAPILDNDHFTSLSQHVKWIKQQKKQSFDNYHFNAAINQLNFGLKANQHGLNMVKQQLMDSNKTLIDILSKLTAKHKISQI